MEDYFETLEGIENALFGIGSVDKKIATQLQGKGLTPTKEMIKAVKQISAGRTQQLLQPLNRTQGLLVGKVNELDAGAQQKMRTGDLMLQDGDLFVRKLVAGGGSIELLEASTVKDNGRSSFQGQSLPDNINIMVDRIGLSYATAASGVIDVAAQKYSVDGNRVPTALLNGLFVLTLDDKPVQVWRISKFFSDSTTAMVPNVKADSFVVALDAPKLIKSGVAVGFRIIMPSNITLATTAAHFLEVVLLGAQTGTRSTS
jgi:hypothetical protein